MYALWNNVEMYENLFIMFDNYIYMYLFINFFYKNSYLLEK